VFDAGEATGAVNRFVPFGFERNNRHGATFFAVDGAGRIKYLAGAFYFANYAAIVATLGQVFQIFLNEKLLLVGREGKRVSAINAPPWFV